MMVLGMNAGPLGGHLGGWRHRDAFPTTAMQLKNAIEVAKLAERGKFDLLFLADGNGVRQMDKPELFAANSPSDRPSVFEPVTLFRRCRSTPAISVSLRPRPPVTIRPSYWRASSPRSIISAAAARRGIW